MTIYILTLTLAQLSGSWVKRVQTDEYTSIVVIKSSVDQTNDKRPLSYITP